MPPFFRKAFSCSSAWEITTPWPNTTKGRSALSISSAAASRAASSAGAGSA